MLKIDGSQGEGGGQIVRSSLAMAMVTGTPVRIESIRAGRAKPGLLRQHLTAALAAAEVSDGQLDGAEVGSASLTFRPGRVRSGHHRFSIGTAGSTVLVLQTVLPALLTAPSGSTVELAGGTHNPLAPPFEFLERTFLPQLAKLGPRITARLVVAGFHPAGGGQIHVTVEPVPALRRGFELLDAGPLTGRRIEALVSNLPSHIGQREVATVLAATGWPREDSLVRQVDAAGQGNILLIDLIRPAVTEVVSVCGERGVSAEAVAERAVAELRRYLAADVPVGEHLADQLILPLAMAGGGTFATLPLSRHATTQIDLVQSFLGVPIRVERVMPERTVVTIA